jgi:hypothetical protein
MRIIKEAPKQSAAEEGREASAGVPRFFFSYLFSGISFLFARLHCLLSRASLFSHSNSSRIRTIVFRPKIGCL